MKHGWTYKKLGEVASYINGFAFKPEQWTVGGVPIIRIQNLNNPDASFNHFDGVVPEKVKVANGDLLISWSATLGTYIWEGGDAYLNQHIFKVEFDKGDIDKMYLKYAVSSKLDAMANLVHGATMKHIVKKDFDNTRIPVPPLPVQKQICSLLDKMNRVIEAKKEQLKELDNLAQAIFYDMFGDPTINDKGWEKQKIGDCFSYIKNGANIKQDKSQRGLPITRIETLSNGVFNRDRMGYAGITDKTRYEQYILQDMDLLMSHINSKAYIGRTVLYRKKEGEVFIHGMNLLRLIPLPVLDSVFFCYLTKTDYVKEKIASIRKDAVNQSSFAISDLKKIDIPIPPMALQQAFAEKVEAIERQKELINQSLREVQTLFDSRMDYWFSEENDDLGQLDKLD